MLDAEKLCAPRALRSRRAAGRGRVPWPASWSAATSAAFRRACRAGARAGSSCPL